MVVELNQDNYEREVLESKEPVLVDFWGPKCVPCLALMPIVEGFEKRYAGKLKVTKVNAAAGNRMLCAKLRVLNLPTYILYKDGTEVKRLVGEELTETDLIEAIDAVVA